MLLNIYLTPRDPMVTNTDALTFKKANRIMKK